MELNLGLWCDSHAFCTSTMHPNHLLANQSVKSFKKYWHLFLQVIQFLTKHIYDYSLVA